ncbi:MBL fold metallo-hydrolase [Kangiella sediminilitoris]|uniref:beta-lactamase n=1 Tax=Kangiella sediminilitoris TaxID=1144748 RepID=A0A1B3BCM3_9GAMM|nr:MBL fold metallo-hydrolase [Kangiella sediminilitoris]AOE50561.1 Beta-lactamase domain protein [Kangiella sediminilitoris]
MNKLGISMVVFSVLPFCFSPSVQAHSEEKPEVTIKTEKLSDGIYVLFGQGGNIGVSVGDDGVYIIDDQYAPLSEKINKAIDELTDKPVRFVINTHWHGDHTGGNENFGKAGAVIVAHDNVRQRMSTEQVSKFFGRVTPASPKAALPVVTFDSEISLHLNGDDMRAYHVANAHTDGDAIIYFEKDNVLHMGDTYFNIGYPYIDTGSGGSIDGYIAAVERGLELADDNTKIIPGHGPMSNKKELQEFGDMLKDLRQKVAALKDKGMSLDEVIAANPSAEYDADNGQAFIKPKQIVTFIYNSL